LEKELTKIKKELAVFKAKETKAAKEAEKSAVKEQARLAKEHAKAEAAAEKAAKADAEAAAEKAAKVGADVESSSDEDGARAVVPKMDAPKQSFDGDAGEWKGWLRTIKLWHNARKKYASGKTLGALLMESVQGDARTTVYSHVAEGKEKYSAIMACLVDEYDLDPVLRVTDAIAALRECKRGAAALALA